jgi:DNA-binding MarR family transcriptional regulator
VTDVQELAERFNRHLRDVVLLLRRASAELPLTMQQFTVLGSLEGGPRRMTELATEHGVRMPTMTVQVNRLEREGLAERRADPADARRVLVRLTPTGRARLRAARTARTRYLADRLSGLSAADQAAIDAALDALAKVVGPHDGPGDAKKEERI